jgi:cation transport regulator
MPYSSTSELPSGVRDNLPEHAREIFLAAFNNAVEEYSDPKKRRGNETLEEVARKVAWSAVKKDYRKDPGTGQWVKK